MSMRAPSQNGEAWEDMMASRVGMPHLSHQRKGGLANMYLELDLWRTADISKAMGLMDSSNKVSI